MGYKNSVFSSSRCYVLHHLLLFHFPNNFFKTLSHSLSVQFFIQAYTSPLISRNRTMVLRTYGGQRRRRGNKPIPVNFSNDPNDSYVSLPSFPFSSQDSNSVNHVCNRKSKREKAQKKNNKKVSKNPFLWVPAAELTATLMEAQECGEVDEANYALGGLRKAHHIRRASLLSLLSNCATALHCQLLRTQGMATTIIDAVVDLNLEDLPSNLAAATLLYILISDGQDDHLLESTGCVQFLIKLLQPIVYTASEDEAPKFGPIASGKNVGLSTHKTEGLNSSSAAIFSRVQQILVNCKELKSTGQMDSLIERPELCLKWLALLTMEKACSSTFSLDAKSGVVQKTGGNFKDKLRQFGGLDAVFDITLHCQSDLECWLEGSYLSTTNDLRNEKLLNSLTLLLKCLKIVQNATVFSKDNQNHLLGLKRKLNPQSAPFSFVELVINVIKMLSDLCKSQNAASTTSNDSKNSNPFFMGSHDSELDLLKDINENGTVISDSIGMYCDMERESSVLSFNLSQKNQQLTCARLEGSLSISETPSTSMSHNYSPHMGASSSTSRGSGCKTSMNQVEFSDDSLDPFVFDEFDAAPSKWDLILRKQRKYLNEKYEDGCLSQTNVTQQELSNVDKESSSLLADCLLSSVRVLMNLSHENPVGCTQIAAYGGLKIMPLLIARHVLPSFQLKGNKPNRLEDHRNIRHLTNQEFDFLIAFLGLLANLVEKDGHNRSWLAAASILLPASEAPGKEVRSGVIPLLCSIFLANQVRGEEFEEDGYEKWIVQAYSALILAFLSTESKGIREAIADNLPDQNLFILVPVLVQYVEFHLALNMISPETHKAVCEAIESCRIP